jgi:hypothetical protein
VDFPIPATVTQMPESNATFVKEMVEISLSERVTTTEHRKMQSMT